MAWHRHNIVMVKPDRSKKVTLPNSRIFYTKYVVPWCMPWSRGVVVITTAQLHSTKPELKFCTCSNPACSVLYINDGEYLWQRTRLEIRLYAFCQKTILQKTFIIIIKYKRVGRNTLAIKKIIKKKQTNKTREVADLETY